MVIGTQKEVLCHGLVIRKEVRIFLKSLKNYFSQLFLREAFKIFDIADIQSEDELHDSQVICDIPWTELVLFFQHSLQITVSYKSCSQFLQTSGITTGLKRGSVINPFQDDGNDLSRFRARQINNGHVHSALDTFIQVIQEDDVVTENKDGDVLLRLGVIDPLKDIIEDSLFPPLSRQNLRVSYHQYQFLLFQQLQLFVQPWQINGCISDCYMLCYRVFAQDCPQLSRQVLQKLCIGLVYAAIHSYQVSFYALTVLEIASQALYLTVLAAVDRPNEYQTITADVILVLLQFFIRDNDVRINVMLAHVLDQFIDEVFSP